MRIRGYSLCLCLIGVWALAGCSGGDGLPDGARGTVSGTVTFNGGSLPEGSSIVFSPEGGSAIPATSPVASDGSFKLRAKGSFDVPVGIYKISVNPPQPKEMTPEESMEASVAGNLPDFEFKEIPAKYRAPATSGESFEVKEGENTYDLEMKPE